jgi:hypothetical protein
VEKVFRPAGLRQRQRPYTKTGPGNRAAEQLLPYADSGLPMIIVLDNYRQKGISLEERTLGGVFGELPVQIRIDTTTGRNLGEA